MINYTYKTHNRFPQITNIINYKCDFLKLQIGNENHGIANKCFRLLRWFLYFSGYHVRLTRGRSQFQVLPETVSFLSL